MEPLKSATSTAASKLHPTDASKQFLPAFAAAKAYASIFGYELSFTPGNKAKEMPQPGKKPVIVPFQEQDISIKLKNGNTVALGSVMPEGKQHMGPVKSEAALTNELLALVDQYRAKLPKTVPFGAGNAAATFLPAVAQASAYAKLHGMKGVSYEGTGINAKGMEGPVVKATEEQQLYITDKAGKKHKLGKPIMPEATHIKTIKSTSALFDEIRALIDKSTHAS